jgi:hypothetical protein
MYKDTTYTVPNMKRYTLQTSTVGTVASGTTAITDWMYGGCPITSIVIPSTVTSIGIIYTLVSLNYSPK